MDTPITPDSSLLAKKMKKRKPQKDDIPVMPICNYRRKTRVISLDQFPEVVLYALISLMKDKKAEGSTVETIENYIKKRYEVSFPNMRKYIQLILDRAIEMGYLTKHCTNNKQAIYTFPFSGKPLPEFAYFMMQKVAKSLKKRKKKKTPPDKKVIL